MSTTGTESQAQEAPPCRLLSLTDAAIMAQVAPNTLARWAGQGKVTAVRSGGWRKFSEAEMRALAPGKMLTVGQLAHRVRRNPKTVAHWADEGKLPCTRLPGGMRRFTEQDVAAFLGATTAEPGDGQ